MGKEHRPKRGANRPLSAGEFTSLAADSFFDSRSEPYEPAGWVQAAARNSDPCPAWALYEEQPRDLCELYHLTKGG